MTTPIHKPNIDTLAILGNPPAFSDKLYVGRPNIPDRDKLFERINVMLDSRWLSNQGPFEQAFERRCAEILGVKHAIAMTNATLGLEIVAHALGLTGEVIVPAYTFVATAHALRWIGLTPVLCDADPVTHNIDPNKVEALITPRTSAICGTHLWGTPCDVEALVAIARKHNLRLFYDAAHAFGCSMRHVPIGGFGDAEVFSFHATKFINSFEGGIVTTNDDVLAERIGNMRRFGFHGIPDSVKYLGTNAKMPEISAVMGITSLESMPDIVAVNRRNYAQYEAALGELDGVRFYRHNASEQHNFQYVVIEVDEAITGISRDAVVQILHAENVVARRYFAPGLHHMEPYASDPRYANLDLPVTERLCDQVILLPNGTAVNEAEIAETCSLITLVVAHGRELTVRMKKL